MTLSVHNYKIISVRYSERWRWKGDEEGIAKKPCEEVKKKTYSWPNDIDVCGRGLVEVYHTRASDFRNSKAFCGLVGEALDYAAAGEGAACDGRDDDLAYVGMLSLRIDFALAKLPLGDARWEWLTGIPPALSTSNTNCFKFAE